MKQMLNFTSRIGLPKWSSKRVPFSCKRMGSMCKLMGSVSLTSPCSTSCSTAGAVIIFVVDPQTSGDAGTAPKGPDTSHVR